MDLTKVKLQTVEGQTSGATAVYLVIKGSKKLLITSPVLYKKRKDLYTILKEADPSTDTGVVILADTAYPLVKGGYSKEVRKRPVIKSVPKTATRVFRVHPNRLSEKQREKIAGLGERGKYRAEFVEDGMTTDERQHRAREHSALQMAEWNHKSSIEKRKRRIANRKRKDYQPSESEQREPRFEGVEVKEIAKQADLEPVEVRKFLRAKKIGKRGGRYAFTEKEAAKVIRAVKKYYAGRNA